MQISIWCHLATSTAFLSSQCVLLWEEGMQHWEHANGNSGLPAFYLHHFSMLTLKCCNQYIHLSVTCFSPGTPHLLSFWSQSQLKRYMWKTGHVHCNPLQRQQPAFQNHSCQLTGCHVCVAHLPQPLDVMKEGMHTADERVFNSVVPACNFL